jgi:hypothetical protein
MATELPRNYPALTNLRSYAGLRKSAFACCSLDRYVTLLARRGLPFRLSQLRLALGQSAVQNEQHRPNFFERSSLFVGRIVLAW